MRDTSGFRGIVVGLVASAAFGACAIADESNEAAGITKTSNEGLYKVQIESELEPISLNRMHKWTMHVTTAEGEPVDDATIEVDGKMPAHNHGMPTAPKVTRALGNGRYLIEGMLFQMPGDWQVIFDINAGGKSDRVIVDLALD